MFSFSSCITEYSIIPEFVTVKNRVYLNHNGHRFCKFGVWNDKLYWRCAAFYRFKCPARMATKQVNGYDMARMTNSIHSHEFPYVKSSKAQLKKQVNS